MSYSHRLLWQTGTKLRQSVSQFQIISTNLNNFKRFPLYTGPTLRNIRHLCQNTTTGDGQKKTNEEQTREEPTSSSAVDAHLPEQHLEGDSPHDHDPLHSAAHQATHRVSEKVTFSALERIADTLLGKAAKKVGTRAVEQTAAKTAERVGERALDRAGEHVIDGIITRAAKTAGAHAAEASVAKGLEHASEKAGERILKGVLAKATKQTAEEMLPRAGKRAMESAFERGALQAFGRGAEKTLPRAGEMSAVVAGERIASQAARGGVRRGLETVVDRVLIRIGRGIIIALPALGSLFVLHLVNEDRKRAVLEAAKGNRNAARAFWLAFLCDASDLGAHVVIITSLLNIHYGVGPHFPHSWLHTAEYGGLAVAVVSTLSAVVGELLSAGVSWPWWDNNKGPHSKIE
jgi:hypothetical protein